MNVPSLLSFKKIPAFRRLRYGRRRKHVFYVRHNQIPPFPPSQHIYGMDWRCFQRRQTCKTNYNKNGCLIRILVDLSFHLWCFEQNVSTDTFSVFFMYILRLSFNLFPLFYFIFLSGKYSIPIPKFRDQI